MKTLLASRPSPILQVILPGCGSMLAFVTMMLIVHLA